MYIEFNGSRKVSDEEAFMFACGMFDEETEIEKAVFMDIMREARDFEGAKRKIIDYAYSGNWVHRKEEESA